MNTLITREAILELLAKPNGPAASFFLPTGHAASQAAEGRVTLKNLVREAETKLKKFEVPDGTIKNLLAPVMLLDTDEAFWKGSTAADGGLAIFSTGDSCSYYNVPLPLTAEAVVGNGAYTKPLLPLLATPAHFYIAALSKSRPRLYRASEYNIVEVNLAEMPEGFVEAESTRGQQKELGFHTSGSNRNSSAHSMGQTGGSEDSKKADVEKYIADVAKAIDKKVTVDGGRMVLAGVDYLVAMYRAHSSYKHIHADSIAGSPDRESAIELRDEALKLLTKSGGDQSTGHHHGNTTKTILEDLNGLFGTGKASVDALEIVQAAHDGRIQCLIVASDRQSWGFYDADDRSLVFFDQQQANAVEINNLAAIETLRHNGEIYVTTADKIATGNSIGAIYRY